MRLFIAIPLAPEVTAQLSALVARLRRRGDGLRWTGPESWHITLQFLGEATAAQYPCLAATLDAVRASPVPVHFDALACFDRAAVFVLGVHPTPPLLALQQLVTAATRPCGFLPETRPYRPHITLARAKAPASLAALQPRIQSQPAFPRFIAPAFNLYESFLSPAGARYEVRRHFPLAAP